MSWNPRTAGCRHLGMIRRVAPSAPGCEDCLAAGRRDWVHLRLCQTCGHVGCCDSSPGRHAGNAANTELFRRRCAAITAPWGRDEWPAEYFRRYARRWWRIDPARAWQALRMLLARRARASRTKNPIA